MALRQAAGKHSEVNIISGGTGNDILYGGEGGDTLEGGTSNDYLDGGVGKDTYVFEFGHGTDFIAGDEDGGNLHFKDVEDPNTFIVVRESDGDVRIYTDGGSSGTIKFASYSDGSCSVLYDSDGTELGKLTAAGIRGGRLEADESSESDWLAGSSKVDRLEGREGDDFLQGATGDDRLRGGAGTDTYKFWTGDSRDIIQDVRGSTMHLRFSGTYYSASDFTRDSNNFRRAGNNLEIAIDKDSTDGITDKITILNAYDSYSYTGSGNSAFTINIDFWGGSYTEVTNDF